MRNTVLKIILGVMFIAFISFHFMYYYNFRTSPPSKEWAKGIVISRGDINATSNPHPQIIQFGDSFIVAHQDGNKIRVIAVDNVGKKINENYFTVDEYRINKISLLSDGEYIYVAWLDIYSESRQITNIKLDKKLKQVDTWKVYDAQSMLQVGENIMITAFKDKIEINNLGTHNKLYVNAEGPRYVAGANTERGLLVTYCENSSNIAKYFFIKDNKISDIKIAGDMSASNIISKVALAADSKNGYILFEARSDKDLMGNISYMAFSLDGDDYKVRPLVIPPFVNSYNPIGYSAGDEARFLIGGFRFITGSSFKHRIKGHDFEILDLSMKDGKPIKWDFVSKIKEPSAFPAEYGEYAVFCNNVEGTVYDVLITSTNDGFKKVNNRIRADEVKGAVSDIFNALIMSFFTSYIYSAGWVITGIVLMFLMGFVIYSINQKWRKNLFIISYGFTTIVKAFFVNWIFISKFNMLIPKLISNPLTGALICILISLPCFLYGYRRYIIKIEGEPFSSFGIALFTDMILTQIFFVPFID